MGVSKTASFTLTQNRIAELAKAFAHPARIMILEYLLEAKSCVCGDIVDALPLAQSTVSQHLKELKKVGIIIGEVEAPKVCYCINPEVCREVQVLLGGLLERCGCADDCC